MLAQPLRGVMRTYSSTKPIQLNECEIFNYFRVIGSISGFRNKKLFSGNSYIVSLKRFNIHLKLL